MNMTTISLPNSEEDLVALLPNQEYVKFWKIEPIVSGTRVQLELMLRDKQLDHNRIRGLIANEKLPIVRIWGGGGKKEKIHLYGIFDKEIILGMSGEQRQCKGDYLLTVKRTGWLDNHSSEKLSLNLYCPKETDYAQRLLKAIKVYAENIPNRT